MATPIHPYLNLSSARAPAFSPDGRRLAFIADISGLPQVWELDLNILSKQPAWPIQRTFASERVMGISYSRSAARPMLRYTRDAGGNENMQVCLQASLDAPEVNLTAGFETAMHIAGCWMPDGQRFLFAANRRKPALFDLYLQDVSGGAELVWQNETPGFPIAADSSPDGSRVLVQLHKSGSDDALLELDLMTGQTRDLSLRMPATRALPAGYAMEGDAVYLATDLESDFLYIGRLDLESLDLAPVIRHEWDIEHLTLSPDRRRLAYTINREGASELRMYRIETGEEQHAPDLPFGPGVIAPLDLELAYSADSRSVAFAYVSPVSNSQVFVWQQDTNTIEQLTQISQGSLPPDTMVKPIQIRYSSFDGLEIPCWFYRPPAGGEPFPVIVYVHGGPESQFRPSFKFDIQYFLRCGYGVLAPNVRGSTGYGKDFSHLDDGERRMDSVEDLASAAAWLKRQPDVDGRSLIVYGGSYGGFMVLAALAVYPDLWAAGVDIVGISNFVTFLENTSAYRREHREKEYGSLAGDRAFLERISPLNSVDQIRAPLMVIHGANDPRVPLSEAEQLVAALRGRDIPVEILIFGDEGHGIVRRENKLSAYPAIVAFLDRHLDSS